ncbi:MAG: hypothetical protein U5L01_01130 [Rheinheimera sp.]|nr:hypothetical protein [Rheinheimera sp.]
MTKALTHTTRSTWSYQYQQNDVDMYGGKSSLTYRLNQQHQLQAFADSVRIELV